MVNFSHPDLCNKWTNLDVEKNLDEVIEARTFGYLKDLERFQAAGYSKGVTIENTVGLTDDGYTTELRSKDEPVKHKILDIIGDLYLTGYNPLKINANILVKEAGKYKRVISLEEHSVIGGFGSMLAEIFAQAPNMPLLKIMGLRDEFVKVVGDRKYLYEEYKVDSKSIVKTILEK